MLTLFFPLPNANVLNRFGIYIVHAVSHTVYYYRFATADHCTTCSKNHLSPASQPACQSKNRLWNWHGYFSRTQAYSAILTTGSPSRLVLLRARSNYKLNKKAFNANLHNTYRKEVNAPKRSKEVNNSNLEANGRGCKRNRILGKLSSTCICAFHFQALDVLVKKDRWYGTFLR